MGFSKGSQRIALAESGLGRDVQSTAQTPDPPMANISLIGPYHRIDYPWIRRQEGEEEGGEREAD